jgi:hypothetical protein
MSYPIFKNLRLVSSFIGENQVVSMVEDYDKQFLFPMLLKCHQIFYLGLEFEIMLD